MPAQSPAAPPKEEDDAETRVFDYSGYQGSDSDEAVWHIVVEGEGVFNILLARSKPGISFYDEMPPVHAVFVLMGSRDERNYHLRALMHIAQITQAPDFDERWAQARSPRQ